MHISTQRYLYVSTPQNYSLLLLPLVAFQNLKVTVLLMIPHTLYKNVGGTDMELTKKRSS